MIVAVAVLIY